MNTNHSQDPYLTHVNDFLNAYAVAMYKLALDDDPTAQPWYQSNVTGECIWLNLIPSHQRFTLIQHAAECLAAADYFRAFKPGGTINAGALIGVQTHKVLLTRSRNANSCTEQAQYEQWLLDTWSSPIYLNTEDNCIDLDIPNKLVHTKENA